MNKGKIKALLLAVCILALISAIGVAIFAADSNAVDAMEEIEANLAEYKQGQTISVAKDGYIGIPVEVSVYHAGGEIVTGKVDATPIAIYVVNTNVERIGTDSDVNIITSMLERGYIVVIFDYLNNDKAKTPDLDWSVQKIRDKVTDGTYPAAAVPGISSVPVPAGKGAPSFPAHTSHS